MSSPENPQFDSQAPLSTGPQPSLALTPDPLTPDSFPAAPSLLNPVPEPPRDPVWNGWDVLLIAVVAVLSLIVMQVLVLVGAKELIYPHSSWKEVAQKAVLAILAQFFAYIPVAFFMVALVEGKYHVRFWLAIRWNWPRSQWMMLGLGALVLLSLNFLGHFLPMPQSTPFEELFSRPRDAYLMSVFAITLGPLMEELFFRGFLYPVLARRLGLPIAVFFTALGFAALHGAQLQFSWGPVLVIFLVGVVLTMVRAKTNSVAAGVLIHMAYNGTITVAMFAATDGFRHLEKLNQ